MSDEWGSGDAGGSGGFSDSAGNSGSGFGGGGDHTRGRGRGGRGGRGRGVGGRNGDDGGVSSACFNCNETGHMSRDCPTKTSGGGGGNACYNCNETGHMSRDCPTKTSGGGGGNACYNCNETGHMSRECPTKSAGGRGGRGGGRSYGDEDGAEGQENGDATEFNEEKPKEFYIPPEPSTDEAEIFGTGITSGINFGKYEKIPMNITGENPPALIQSFAESGLSEFLLNNIAKSGYAQPTPIQKSAIPVVQAKRDLMGCSQTGSGKTAAYLLPIIHDLLTDNLPMTVGKPQVLIISPTRELTIQIYNEALKFAFGSYLKLCILYGGTSTRHQSTNLGKGSHILVATPGRLLDFVDKGYMTFDEIRYVVLDEADRMLDLGFKPAIEKVMQHETMVSADSRHTLLFSATFPDEIQALASKFLNPNYIFVSVGVIGGACSDVTQNIFEVTKYTKRDKLMEILNTEDPSGTIVFVETKRQADFLASFLSESEHPTTSIHGDRIQRQREEALDDFKCNKMKVLIATSVAARGLDIKNVRHVINYDMPKDIDEYVHRIGRTGRLGNEGKATSFFDPEQDNNICAPLMKILEEGGTQVPDFIKAGGSGSRGGGGASTEAATDIRGGVQSFEPEEDW